MSYDIRFAVKVAGAEDLYAVIGHPEYDTPTYNVGTIFRKCMDFDFQQGTWYPLKEVFPKIQRGIMEITMNSGAYKKYEPDNGWGSVNTVLLSLQSIVAWCSDEFTRGWNFDIPLECIYISW